MSPFTGVSNLLLAHFYFEKMTSYKRRMNCDAHELLMVNYYNVCSWKESDVFCVNKLNVSRIIFVSLNWICTQIFTIDYTRINISVHMFTIRKNKASCTDRFLGHIRNWCNIKNFIFFWTINQCPKFGGSLTVLCLLCACIACLSALDAVIGHKN